MHSNVMGVLWFGRTGDPEASKPRLVGEIEAWASSVTDAPSIIWIVDNDGSNSLLWMLILGPVRCNYHETNDFPHVMAAT